MWHIYGKKIKMKIDNLLHDNLEFVPKLFLEKG